ncbi:MAG: hypothetical protein HY822_21275 [Acidobacteria bacterium]|nr:hypothetical protein [Acidobacteriota bacterium]
MRTQVLVLAAAAALGCAAADLRFHPAQGGAFHFDTGVLKGTLRNEGRSTGLLPVTHVPTGTVMARSMGLFGIYRVFSDGRRYGNGMWSFPSEAELAGDGAVSVRWPPAEDRPFRMQAVYRWAGPATLDISISVRPEQDLHGFEAFLAAYLGEQFTNSAVLAKGGRLLAADRESGAWQMFPRGPEAVSLIRDGRWKLPPNPVDWVVRPEFEFPAAVRRDPASGLAAVVLAPARDCFAIATPQEGDSHYSLYFSLFGRDVTKGETARARARLVVLSSPDEEQVRKLYRGYMRGTM